MSKPVEQAVHRQFSEHIDLHNLDDVSQSAQCSHSSEAALLSVQSNIHLCLSKGEATASCLVLLDLSTAFDTIDHSTLISSILKQWFGVCGYVLQWFLF